MATPLLQPPLARLFTPRPSLLYLKQIDREPKDRIGPKIDGIGAFMYSMENQEVTGEITESVKERRARKVAERKRKCEERLKNDLWDPQKDEKIKSDPFKTIINYETNEKRLQREFERYGSVKSVRIVNDMNGKPRGYAFVEYSKEKELKAAYRDADGIKIDQKRVIVDIERGRTIKGFKPRRLGGGLGGSRIGGKNENQKYAGRDPRAANAFKEEQEERPALRNTGFFEEERRNRRIPWDEDRRRADEGRNDFRRGDDRDRRIDDRRSEDRDRRGEDRRSEDRRHDARVIEDRSRVGEDRSRIGEDRSRVTEDRSADKSKPDSEKPRYDARARHEEREKLRKRSRSRSVDRKRQDKRY